MLPASAGAPRPILLAVSGGPDSLALLVLASENRERLRAAGFAAHVATVDHALRDGSAAEADMVARVAARCGLPHATLPWTGPKPASNLQAHARDARYRLLRCHAERLGAAAILTAHHEDDRIEGWRIACLRRAGDRGRAGMRIGRELSPGVLLLRPFLDVPRARLARTVADRELRAIRDPANSDTRFLRARVRREAEGAGTAARARILAAIAEHARRRDAEDAAIAGLLRRMRDDDGLSVDDRGVLRVGLDILRNAGPRAASVFLARALRSVAGAAYPPSHVATERLAARLERGERFRATLNGAVVDVADELAIHREYGRRGTAARAVEEGSGEFDGRFQVETVPIAPGSRLVAFGSFGRGNAAEKTLPVLVDAQGRTLAAHPALLRRLPCPVAPLAVRELVSFGLHVDLPRDV